MASAPPPSRPSREDARHSVCTADDRNLETAAKEKLKSLGRQCRVGSVFTRETGTGIRHAIAADVRLMSAIGGRAFVGQALIDAKVKAS